MGDRVRRYTRGLQTNRAGVEQRSKIISSSAELIGETVERRVRFDWAGEQAAERNITVLLAEGLSGAIGPLKLWRVDVETHRARNEVRSGATAYLELRATKSTA